MEGSKDPFFTFFGPSRVLATNEVYDPATNKWETRRPMSVPRNHAFSGVVNGKIGRHRRPDRARLHLVGDEHGCGGGVQPGQRLLERAARTDAQLPEAEERRALTAAGLTLPAAR